MKRKPHSEEGWAVLIHFKNDAPFFAVSGISAMDGTTQTGLIVCRTRAEVVAIRDSWQEHKCRRVVRVRITEVGQKRKGKQ